jgi:hypothetical protein
VALDAGVPLKISPLEDRFFRAPRRWSNHVLRSIAPVFGAAGEVINVSGWDDGDKEGGRYRDYFAGASRYYVSNFVGERGAADPRAVVDFELDLEAPLTPALRGRFDVVYNHTTLEHVFDVFAAFANLCEMSRDVVVLVVPFSQKMHACGSFGDYWRFTPMALRRLFERSKLAPVFEAVQDDFNAGLYVVGAGARHPDRWRAKLPPYAPIDRIGTKIGRNPLRRIARRLGRRRGDESP